MTTKLSVNLNKVATLRNTRAIGIPSVTRAAHVALDAGAHGITIHPRPDERHIRPDDVIDLARLIADYADDHSGGAARSVELNIEGNPFEGLVEHALRVRPTQCTLVPDGAAQATSDHGWNLVADGARLAPIVAQLKAAGCRVSLFMDAVPESMARARDVGADRVELYTEPYAAAFARGGHAEVIGAFRDSARAAEGTGLGVNAGHDLNLENLGPFLDAVAGVLEVSIGHALIADALELGLGETVRRYLAIVDGERAR